MCIIILRSSVALVFNVLKNWQNIEQTRARNPSAPILTLNVTMRGD